MVLRVWQSLLTYSYLINCHIVVMNGNYNREILLSNRLLVERERVGSGEQEFYYLFYHFLILILYE